MIDVSRAIFDRLTGSPDLAALISTYASAPAIFTATPIPADATYPIIVSSGNVSDSSSDNKTGRGREITRDVFVYAEEVSSASSVEEIAGTVLNLLRVAPLTVPEGIAIVLGVNGPIEVDAPDGFQGRALTVRLLVEEV
ncbi:MAG: hypothetical protein A3E78_14205 [Alphaproteobacteria bacterium RIFCSPHIGHO2_12_FULL_63_12]|nr:MAG: hypothetical protein A3E78_14205 [Alphaproteobacteria bacterium RIFCSPHIGHO2_12_FULL_63_12]